MNEYASQTDSAILLVLGLGGLAYWALSRDKNEEKAAEFRSYEISSGKGIRLNSFHSKLRVSAFPNPAQSKSALNALEEFQSTGRPVISSMGDIAASGGVWVTTTSEEIWAENTTLTGSIGVYSIIPEPSPLLNWAGIHNDGISMTKAGDVNDLSRGMNEELNEFYGENTENIYKDFVTRVANNRGMNFSEVLDFAGGRIWRGDTALELGLVDKLGSLDEAIESMVTKLDLKDYKAFSYNNEVEFDDYLNSLTQDILPIQIQSMFNNIGGLNSLFLSNRDRYVVAYCFECGFKNFK